MPIEVIDIIKSYASWNDQLKLSFCRKELLGSSLLVGRFQHQEALVNSIKSQNVKLLENILLNSRRYPLPDGFPFGDEFLDLVFNNDLLGRAEHLEIFKLFLSDERVDPSDQDNGAIKLASEFGYLEVVKLLLSDGRVDLSADDGYANRWASEEGHVQIVKLLLSDGRVDPLAQDNYASGLDSRNGQLEVVNLLLSDARFDESVASNF